MKKLVLACIAASTFVPFAAALADDKSYCHALSDTYRRWARSRTQTDGGVPQAMAACDTKPAEGIPTLEAVLTKYKVELPKRE